MLLDQKDNICVLKEFQQLICFPGKCTNEIFMEEAGMVNGLGVQRKMFEVELHRDWGRSVRNLSKDILK